MRQLFAAIVIAATASVASAQEKPKADAPKDDLAKLQGKWSATVGPNKDIPIVFEIKDRTVTLIVTIEGEDRTITGELKIDETKSPKHLDWLKFTTPDGQELDDNLAIYKIDGDELTTCSGGPGNERPTEFKEGEGGPPNLTVLKRVKDEAKKEEKK